MSFLKLHLKYVHLRWNLPGEIIYSLLIFHLSLRCQINSYQVTSLQILTNLILKEYTNGDRYVQRQQQQQMYRHAESGEVSAPNYDRRDKYTCPASHRPPFNRRPVKRVRSVFGDVHSYGINVNLQNSNILSAVLCLVKELDCPSLEVVEMAVRCRMDELDEWRRKGAIDEMQSGAIDPHNN